MAKKKKIKGKHVLLRKMMVSLMLTCFLVFVMGQISQGVSPSSLLIWASILLILIGIVMQIVLRFWSAWEEISERSRGNK